MNKSIVVSIILAGLVSCEVAGVKDASKDDDIVEVVDQETLTEFFTDVSVEKNATEFDEVMGEKLDEPEVIAYDNGISITWKRRGQGSAVVFGNMVNIDYRVSLEDGGIYDGNHLIDKKFIPFLVGWGLQTEGWDFAFQKLKEGDDVEIFLPAALARGEKGIPGIVPPNANNIISVRVLGIREPTVEVDGIRIWRVEQAKHSRDSIQYNDVVNFHYMVSTPSNPRYDNSYQRGETFEYVMGEDNIIPGLYKALYYARKGDKLMIHIPSDQAYGAQGLKGLVAPNEDIFYDILITEVKKSTKS
jgi:FKBP-type peptidyl-prolyl cis-trans isomerase